MSSYGNVVNGDFLRKICFCVDVFDNVFLNGGSHKTRFFREYLGETFTFGVKDIIVALSRDFCFFIYSELVSSFACFLNVGCGLERVSFFAELNAALKPLVYVGLERVFVFSDIVSGGDIFDTDLQGHTAFKFNA